LSAAGTKALSSIVVKLDVRIRWFRSERDLWVLDVNKWRNEFVDLGYNVPDFNDKFRFGLRVINQENAKYFLDCMSEYEINKDSLSITLAQKFTSANSWWDVKELFPIMFVNFDERKVGAFYPDGIRMERYIPDGWKGEFIDFANEYSEDVFPVSEKFWVKKGCDLLALLNERGAGK